MTQVQVGEHYSLPVAAETLPHLRLKYSSGNYAVAGANDKSIAISESHIFDAGAMMSGLVKGWPGVKRYKSAKAIAAGVQIYGAAGGLVTDTYTFGAENLGISVTSCPAANCIILVMPTDASQDLHAAIVAASSAVTNTTVETAFDQQLTIPPNTLQVGDIIRIKAQAIATATNSTDTLLLKLLLGATVLASSPTVDVANNDIGVFDIDCVIRTIGAGGTFVAMGQTSLGVPGTATGRPVNLGSTAIDTTAANIVKATATWSVANAGNSCRLDILNVSILR